MEDIELLSSRTLVKCPPSIGPSLPGLIVGRENGASHHPLLESGGSWLHMSKLGGSGEDVVNEWSPPEQWRI